MKRFGKWVLKGAITLIGLNFIAIGILGLVVTAGAEFVLEKLYILHHKVDSL